MQEPTYTSWWRCTLLDRSYHFVLLAALALDHNDSRVHVYFLLIPMHQIPRREAPRSVVGEWRSARRDVDLLHILILSVVSSVLAVPSQRTTSELSPPP